MAHQVAFINCFGCQKLRALRVDAWPFCKLCKLMGEEDKWYKQHARRYLIGGRLDLK